MILIFFEFVQVFASQVIKLFELEFFTEILWFICVFGSPRKAPVVSYSLVEINSFRKKRNSYYHTSCHLIHRPQMAYNESHRQMLRYRDRFSLVYFNQLRIYFTYALKKCAIPKCLLEVLLCNFEKSP